MLINNDIMNFSFPAAAGAAGQPSTTVAAISEWRWGTPHRARRRHRRHHPHHPHHPTRAREWLHKNIEYAFMYCKLFLAEYTSAGPVGPLVVASC